MSYVGEIVDFGVICSFSLFLLASSIITAQTIAVKKRVIYIIKAEKHELFPFPYSVMSRNPNLVQNKGW